MIIHAGMFSGSSFAGNLRVFEGVLGRYCSDIPVDAFRIHDPEHPVGSQPTTVRVEEGRYVSAAFLAALARGRPRFVLTASDLATAITFFAEHWQNSKGHATIELLKEVGVGATIEVVWKIEEVFRDGQSESSDAGVRTLVSNARDMLELGLLRRATLQDSRGGWIARPWIKEVILNTIDMLELGLLRAATQDPLGGWIAHPWIKEVILAYFKHRTIEPMDNSPPFHFADMLGIQTPREGVRVVPPGVIRRGACVEPGVIVMPGYVNIGAYVGAGSMVDTWATVGSCAQIGRNVHLAGGVGIGGVLEPAGAMPVIIEDGVFVGSRAVIVEGVIVEREAVIAANVSLAATTPIIDMTGEEPKEYRGRVPSRAIVVPGTRIKQFKAGKAQIACAYIIAYRTEATDRKVSLEGALREVREAGACV